MSEATFIQASDGVNLASHISGTGAPLYVIHGGPSNDHTSFGNYLDPIAAYRQLHLLDQRGCGDSNDGSPETYTLERLAQDIEDTRVGMGHDKIDILGHSYGCLIGLTYALRWPENIGTLVLASCSVRGWKGVLLSPASWPVWGKQILLNFRKDTDWVEFALKHDVGNREKFDEVRRLHSPKRHDPARVDPLMKAAIRPIDVTTLVEKRVRLAAIVGRQDRRFVGDAGYLRSKGIPVELIDNCGHHPFVEQPEQFHAALRRFLVEGAGEGA